MASNESNPNRIVAWAHGFAKFLNSQAIPIFVISACFGVLLNIFANWVFEKAPPTLLAAPTSKEFVVSLGALFGGLFASLYILLSRRPQDNEGLEFDAIRRQLDLVRSFRDAPEVRGLKGETESVSKRLESETIAFSHAIHVSKTVARTLATVKVLEQRGRVNLSLGMTIAIAGLVYLSYIVLQFPAPSDLSGFISTFLPKLSLVLLIETFAYFFLLLYRSGLQEIKYFQNEATNVELYAASLELALARNDEKLITACVRRLIHIDRNAVAAGVATKIPVSDDSADEELIKKIVKQAVEAVLDAGKGK